MNRILTPYEKTHLARFGKSNIDIKKFGEMPVEYITGRVEFDNKVFNVNDKVLIPRIETEELIKIAFNKALGINPPASAQPEKLRLTLLAGMLKALRAGHKALTIADVGCGSGAIGICIADRIIQNNLSFNIFMSDVSESITEVAAQNIKNLLPVEKVENSENLTKFHLPNKSKISLLVSDLLDEYPDTKFDLFVANLPYIPESRINVLDSSVKDFEPFIALSGGKDGLFLIKKFASQAVSKLSSQGKIILEIDYTHDQQVLEKNLKNWHVKSIFDQFNRQRFAILSLPKQ